MQLSPEEHRSALKELCKAHFAKAAQDAFGSAGIDALMLVLDALSRIYAYVEPTLIEGPAIVANPTDDSMLLDRNKAEPIQDFSALLKWTRTGFVLELCADGAMYVALPASLDVIAASQTAVVYEYDSAGERFVLRGKTAEVPKLVASCASQFSVPTFRELGAALEHYGLRMVRMSSCLMLKDVWADDRRIFLKRKPEARMRDSLNNFLAARLDASHEVRPEQSMDESHPVDLKVTHHLSNRMAIIEIKWLGDSRGPDGKITVRHRDARAIEGAKQLAGYLDQNIRFAPLQITRGYYVLIDARRRGLSEATVTVSKADGMYYCDTEIDFDVHYDQTRADFERPFRMFVEPLCDG
ncbi:MAG: hypothetical protein NTX53_07805 [candidate division WOR-3 bacterium]|nr:hypothetical protein [candidate division WOR-3 bacterium]